MKEYAGTKDGLLQLQHAFGCGTTCSSIEVITTFDEDGESKDLVLHSVGQHVALSHVLDGRMKFLTWHAKEVRRVMCIELAPDKQTVAVSEWTGTCTDGLALDEKITDTSTKGCTSTTCSGAAHIAIYHLSSRERLQTLSLPTTSCEMSSFISMAFLPDSKRLVAVSDGGKLTSTSERQIIVLWTLESETIGVTAAVPSGYVTRIRTRPVGSDKLILTTSGKQHFKAWVLSESGFKMQSVLPSSQEVSEQCLDHQWTGTKKSPPKKTAKAGTVKMPLETTKQGHGVLLITGSLLKPSSEQDEGGEIAEACDARVVVFASTGSPPYLEQIATQPIFPTGQARLTALAVHCNGFCVAGTQGYFAAFERQGDSQRPYAIVGSFSTSSCCLGKAVPSWSQLCVSSNGETLVASAKDRLYTYPLGDLYSCKSEDNIRVKHLIPMALGKVVPHDGAILAMDICAHRPFIVTCGSDHSVRLWHHENRHCELLYQEEQPGVKPCCLALHPSAFQLIIGFPEQTRLYSVIFQGLKPLHVLSLSRCQEVRYAHGGHQFACAAGVMIIIYSAISFASLYTLSGHLLPASCVVWAADDLSLFSTGSGGTVCAWDLVDMLRIEEASQLNHASPNQALAASLPRRGTNTPPNVAFVVVASTDGTLRAVSWDTVTGEGARTRDLQMIMDIPPSSMFTALAISSSAKYLFGGTSAGTICVFACPVTSSGDWEHLAEFSLHSSAVNVLCISDDDMHLFTAGADGVIFVVRICADLISQPHEDATDGQGILSNKLGSTSVADDDLVQVSLFELQKNADTMADLARQLESRKTENEFALRRKDMHLESQLKKAQDAQSVQLAAAHTRLKKLNEEYETSMQECHAIASRKASHHVQVTHDLENQYEHKLALEMERYDALSEEIEAVQQRCEGLLEAQQTQHLIAIRNAEVRTKRVEKELRQQIDRLHEDARHNEQMFREVLDQQEHEYETELQQLMTAAQTELSTERESTAEARGLIQTRNTKISRLEKRMDELKTSSHARNVVLTAEKVRNAKLEATLRHFKRHMEERESTLEDKELSILKLRRKNVTLDNFRFVLDHRVQQLMEERGPVTTHVGGLEAHISAMYDELESEYYKMKRQGQELDSKELKIHTLSREVAALRGFLREREAYIASFKRELSTLVCVSAPKDLEDAIKSSYHRFVKEEPPRNKANKSQTSQQAFVSSQTGPKMLALETCKMQQTVETNLQDALTEAHSQRHFIQQTAGNLEHRLNIAKTDTERQLRIKLDENSSLISECNRLRGEHLCLSREVNHLRQVVKDQKSIRTKHRGNVSNSQMSFESAKPQMVERQSGALRPIETLITPVMQASAGPQSSDSVYRGSTRSLSLWSTREGRIAQMSSQLDENSKKIGTQDLEINRLRSQIKLLVDQRA